MQWLRRSPSDSATFLILGKGLKILPTGIFPVPNNSTQTYPFWGRLTVDINFHLSNTFLKVCVLTWYHFSTLLKLAFPIPCSYPEGFVLFNLELEIEGSIKLHDLNFELPSHTKRFLLPPRGQFFRKRDLRYEIQSQQRCPQYCRGEGISFEPISGWWCL